MRQSDVVIIGGSAAGVTAAITARRHYPDKKVFLIRKEQQVMIPCGIPYIFGTLGSPEKNLIPDALLDKNGIDLCVAEATAIDRARKTVATSAGEVAYDRLILATGSVPRVPPVPGRVLQNAMAWPNPFVGRVSLRFDLAAPAAVRLEVTDVAGRRVWSSAVAALDPGRHSLTWDGALARGGSASAGVYFLRVSGPRFAITRPVVRVK